MLEKESHIAVDGRMLLSGACQANIKQEGDQERKMRE